MSNTIGEKLALSIQPYMIKIEIGMLLVFLLGLIFMDQGGGILITISLSMLSVVYFLITFLPQTDNNSIELFIYKLTYLSLAVGVLSILFKIRHNVGADMMMKIALSTVLFCAIGSIVLKIRKKKEEPIFDLNTIRIVILILSISSIFLWGNEKYQVPEDRKVIPVDQTIPSDNN